MSPALGWPTRETIKTLYTGKNPCEVTKPVIHWASVRAACGWYYRCDDGSFRIFDRVK